MKQKELSVIIVSYNVKDILKTCVISLGRCAGDIDHEIIIVDNASSDGSAEMVKNEFPNIRLIQNAENLGFAKANNQGIFASKGQYVLLLNPDTLLIGDAVSKMLGFIKTRDDAAFVGPALFDSEEKDYQPSIRKFSKPLYVFLQYLPLSNFALSLYYRFLFNYGKIRAVDWLPGAALLTKKEVLDRIGNFDEGFFMYSEKEDLCHRARKNGHKVYYFPEAEVVHFKGSSSKKDRTGNMKLFWKSKMLFFKRYSTPRRIAIFKTCFIILLNLKMLFRIIPSDEYHRELIKTVRES